MKLIFCSVAALLLLFPSWRCNVEMSEFEATLVQSAWTRVTGTTINAVDEAVTYMIFPRVLSNAAEIQSLRFSIYDPHNFDSPRIVSLTLNVSVSWLAGVDPIRVWVSTELDPTADAFVTGTDNPLTPTPIGAPQIVWGPGLDYASCLAGSGWVQVGYDDGTGWTVVGNTAQISIPLGTTVFDPVNSVSRTGTAIMTNIHHAEWDGLINLGLQVERQVSNPTYLDSVTLEVEDVAFFTGIENHGAERGRPVRDMRTGFPVHVGDLVEDGYRPGIWTVQSQQDSEDPRDARPVQFPDSEGTWPDDVPAR